MALPTDQVESFVEAHPGWSWADDAITRTYKFADFNQAMGFVTRVALLSEKADHHPDIDIRWNRVTLRLTTHSAGALTQRDLSLAEQIDRLV